MRGFFHIIWFVCIAIVAAVGGDLVAELPAERFASNAPIEQSSDAIDQYVVNDINYGEVARCARARTVFSNYKSFRGRDARRNLSQYRTAYITFSTGKIIDYNILTHQTRQDGRLPMAAKSCYELVIRIGKLISEP